MPSTSPVNTGVTYAGECKSCGRVISDTFRAQKPETTRSGEVRFRCGECDQINRCDSIGTAQATAEGGL